MNANMITTEEELDQLAIGSVVLSLSHRMQVGPPVAFQRWADGWHRGNRSGETHPTHFLPVLVAPLPSADAGTVEGTPPPALLREIAAERRRQHTKWGEQNHPNGTGPTVAPLLCICADKTEAAALADLAKFSTEEATEEGIVTYADILLEEVFEALAEADPQQLRAELVQVAAVSAQWIEAIDRAALAGDAK